MKILALESSAVSASAAVAENGRIIASAYINVKLTHSQTLMPMVENMLKASLTDISEIDGIAVSHGPGSFTGIRIGISAAKGLAAPRNLPCAGVSALLAAAYALKNADGIVCAVMDARCNQFYTALFDIKNGDVTRLCGDCALSSAELAEKIKKLSQNGEKRVIITGDGTDVFYPSVKDIPSVIKADEGCRFQNAVSVALASEEVFKNGGAVTADKLLPVYLRLPQAERELKKKQAEEKK